MEMRATQKKKARLGRRQAAKKQRKRLRIAEGNDPVLISSVSKT
jgi:hypothetical protein